MKNVTNENFYRITNVHRISKEERSLTCMTSQKNLGLNLSGFLLNKRFE